MDKYIGKATYRRGKLYFDAVGWSLVKEAAKKQKKSPTQVVNAALRRYIRSRDGKKAQNA